MADDNSLTLPMDTVQAVAKINGHVHEAGLGNPIGAGGIQAKAITEEKFDDSSVPTRAFQPDSVLLTNLHPDVRAAIAAGGSEGVPGLTNFIAEGLGITAGSGLTVAVQPGRASIAEKTVKLTTSQNITVDARMASLLYAQKQADSDVPLIGKINSISPLATIDNNTIAMWIFNQTTAGAAIPNSAVGVSGIAVANNLVASGGLTSVDGRIDHAIKADGTSGCYVSQNLTGFPTGANTVSMAVMFTVNTVPTTIAFIASYGTASTNRGFGAYIGANGNLYIFANTADIDTGYAVSANTDYLLELNYNGSIFTVYVNGSLVYTSGAITLNIGTTYNFTVLRHSQVASYYSSFTIHHIEIRNALRTAQQISNNANKFLFPNFYTDTSGNRKSIKELLPVDSIALGFVQTSSSAILAIKTDYAYGRREGAVNGNRRKFLGWKYYSGSVTLKWDNPFGTRKINTYYTCAQDANGTNEVDLQHAYQATTGTFYGIQDVNTSAERIRVVTTIGGVALINGAWQTSGYIGCYAETLEDD